MKTFRFILAPLAAVALLASCGGDSTQTAQQQPIAEFHGSGSGDGTATPQVLAFVACPEYRNFDAATGDNGCWVTSYKGQKFSLTGAQGQFPQLGHSVLVEAQDEGGTATSCGGRVLKDVRVSVLPELNPACQTILPSEGVTPPPAVPFEFSLPDLNPPWPYVSSTYTVFFQHQSYNIETLFGAMHAQVEIAANLAMRGDAKAVVVTGYAVSTLLSDGGVSLETPELAQARAQRVVQALQILGVPASIIHSSGSGGAVPADTADIAWRGRFVTIFVQL